MRYEKCSWFMNSVGFVGIFFSVALTFTRIDQTENTYNRYREVREVIIRYRYCKSGNSVLKQGSIGDRIEC